MQRARQDLGKLCSNFEIIFYLEGMESLCSDYVAWEKDNIFSNMNHTVSARTDSGKISHIKKPTKN